MAALPETSALESSTGAALIEGLRDPAAYDHPVGDIEVIETHISWVILAGDYAYKIKKPVRFAFLDFSTLALRHHYCEEELRLNRRFAPELYLDVVQIRGSAEIPRLYGDDDVLEYALRMRRFRQSQLLSVMARRHELEPSHIDAIAERVAGIHREISALPPETDYGSSRSVAHWSAENLDQLRAAIPALHRPPAFHRLEAWYRDQKDLLALVDQRREAGRVRECHGDLHLGNLALIDDKITLFDCIEFNPELRWIDTISEAAFVSMDLEARGYPGYAWRFIDRYLAADGDYDGLPLLRYYLVYRALVRAKVEALRANPQALTIPPPGTSFEEAVRYLALADSHARDTRAGLVVMHGLSGSGKSTVAAALVESLGAIRVRSDVERKRLFALEAGADSQSSVDGGIYTADASERTYDRLAEIAGLALDAGQRVIIDAACLQRRQRKLLIDVARERSCPAVIVACQAPETELRRRILARQGDASEADLAVLAHQLDHVEPLDAQENSLAVRAGPIDTGTALSRDIGQRLGVENPLRATI